MIIPSILVARPSWPVGIFAQAGQACQGGINEARKRSFRADLHPSARCGNELPSCKPLLLIRLGKFVSAPPAHPCRTETNRLAGGLPRYHWPGHGGIMTARRSKEGRAVTTIPGIQLHGVLNSAVEADG